MQLQIRDAIVTLVEAPYLMAFPAVPLVIGNSPFNWNDPPNLFATFEVEFNRGERISLGGPLKTRVHGYAYVTTRSAPGTGERAALGVLDWFSTQLGEAILTAPGYRIVLQAPQPGPGPAWAGWSAQEVKFRFTADPT